MIIVGNDISKYQDPVNWDVYKNNSNFVIIKATEGNGFTDPSFLRNQAEARRVGIPLGYYHFARPDLGNTPEAEAEYCLKIINGFKEGEILALDYECANQKQSDIDWCKKWLDYIQNKLGFKPLIYLNQSQVKNFNWQVVVDAGYGLWLASYQADGVGATGQWSFMAMQQTSSSQQVPGLTGNADRDIFFGDVATLKKYGYKAPVAQPTPPSTPPEAIVSDPSSKIKLGASYGVLKLSEVISKIDTMSGQVATGVAFREGVQKIIVGKGWPWQKVNRIKSLLNG